MMEPAPYEPGDAEHYEALARTGFFGRQAAGCLPLAKTTGRVMLALRSALVEQPHTWGTIGGAHDASETPVDAAYRELLEETGYSGRPQLHPLLVFRSGTFQYSNFLALVEEEFIPALGWEAVDYGWFALTEFPSPLHFGVQALLRDAPSVRLLSQLFPPADRTTGRAGHSD